MSTNTLLKMMLIGLLLTMAACASKQDARDHDGHANHDESVWPEMDVFHMIMAETFHPYKDSSNLEPARQHASELMTAADAWASSTLPGKVDNEEMRTMLAKLRAEATTLAESAKAADDNVIGEQLTRLHDTFHEIQEAWYGGH